MVGLWRAGSSVLAYAWSAEALTRYGNLVSLAIVCGMLFFHLTTIKPHHPRRFAISAWVMLLAGAGLMLMTNLQSTGRAADELYMSVLLPPEVADTTMHAWEGAAPAVIGLALIAIFSCAETWLSDVEPFALIHYLLVLASSLGLGLLWAGGWALANRLFGSHARMGRHLFIVGSGLAVVFIWRAASNVIAYAWSLESFTGYGSLVTLAIICAMLFFHLLTIKPHHPRRFAITAWVMLVVGSALSLLNNAQSTGRTSDELYMSVLLPPEVRQSPDRNLEQFLINAAKLKEGADAARARSVRDGFGDGDDDSDGEVTD